MGEGGEGGSLLGPHVFSNKQAFLTKTALTEHQSKLKGTEEERIHLLTQNSFISGAYRTELQMNTNYIIIFPTVSTKELNVYTHVSQLHELKSIYNN